MKHTQTLTILSIAIAVLALIAAATGVFWQGSGSSPSFTTVRGEVVPLQGHGLYRFDSLSFATQGIAQDVVTLILGIPLLVTGLVLARKGSLRGRLLLTGTLAYMLYSYITYSFLSAFNEMFLVYVAIFSLSLFAFILALSGLDPDLVTRQINKTFPRRGLAIFMTLIGAFLTLAWLGRILPAQLAGLPPVGLESSTTLGIQALDLAVIVPTAFLTAVLLWRSRPWGLTLAAVLIVKLLTMGAALVAMIINMVLTGVPVSAVESGIFIAIAVAGVVFMAAVFRGVNEPAK